MALSLYPSILIVAGFVIFAAAFWAGPLTRGADGRRFTPRCFILPAGVALMMAFGWSLGGWRASVAEVRIRDVLDNQGQNLARAVNPDLLRELSWSSDDRFTPEFERLSHQLSSYAKAASLRSVYTMALRDGRIIFGPESLPEDDVFASPPGTEYQRPPAGLSDAFATGRGALVGPYSDEYGVFISAFSPILDGRTGKVLAVLGLDMPAGEWKARIDRARLFPQAAALAVALLFTAWGYLAKKRSASGCAVMSWREGVVLVLFAGALLTASISLVVRQGEIEAVRARFEQISQGYAQAIGDEIREIRRYRLAGMAVMLEANEEVTPAKFERLAGPFMNDLFVSAYEWIPAPADGSLVASAAAPADAMKFLSRFDHASDPIRREALDRAKRTLLPAVAGPVILVEEGGMDKGLIFYSPVRRRAEDQGVLKGEGVAGFVAAAVSPEGLMEGILRIHWGASPAIGVDLLSIGGDGTCSEVASWPKGHDHAGAPPDLSGADPMTAIFPLFAFGRAFAIVMHPGPAFVASFGVRLWIAAAAVGLLFTAVVALIVGSLGFRRRLLESEVEERTSELHETRERFAQMAELSREIIWEADSEGLYTYVSRACSSLLGYEPDEIVGKMHFYDLHPEDGREEFKRSAFDVLKRRGMFKELPNRLVCKDGRVVWVSTNGQPVISNDGTLLGYRGVDRDVTESVEADEALQKKMTESATLTKLMVGREGRLIELKREVNALLAELGREPKYGA
ncbi:MAG TPA: PAS domain S-box protein [bacterium]|nr:PAS domain S-box protein [bacterium]